MYWKESTEKTVHSEYCSKKIIEIKTLETRL